MADLTIPQRDKGYYINFTVQDSDSVVYNLTGYTITLKVWAAGRRGSPIVDAACSIVSASAGTCRYLVAAGDFNSKGLYQLELNLTKSGVIESTTTYTVEVKESP